MLGGQHWQKYNKTITALCVGKHPDLSTLGEGGSLGQALGENNFPLRLTNLDVSLHKGP